MRPVIFWCGEYWTTAGTGYQEMARVCVRLGDKVGTGIVLRGPDERRLRAALDAMQAGLRALCSPVACAPAMVWEGFTSMPAWSPTVRVQRISVYVTSAQSRDPSDGLLLTDAHTVAWASACAESLRAGMRALAGGS